MNWYKIVTAATNWWEKPNLSLFDHVSKYLWASGKSYCDKIHLVNYDATAPEMLEEGKVYLNQRLIQKNVKQDIFILNFVVKNSKNTALRYSLGVKNKTFDQLQEDHTVKGELLKVAEVTFHKKQAPFETDEQLLSKLPPEINESNYYNLLDKNSEEYKKFLNIPFEKLPPFYKNEFSVKLKKYKQLRDNYLLDLKIERTKNAVQSYTAESINKPVGRIFEDNIVEFFNNVADIIETDSIGDKMYDPTEEVEEGGGLDLEEPEF